MTRLAGTITLNFVDTDSVSRDLFAQFSTTLMIATSGNVCENPDDKAWENAHPELSEWTVDLAFNVVEDDDTGILEISQSEIEALALARTIFPVTFTAASGAEYDSTAFVTGYKPASGDQRIFTGSLSLRGATKLTPTNP